MEIAPSQRLNGIGEYYFSQKLREIDALNRAGKNVINLGIGSPDLPPHPDVIATLQQQAALPQTHAYQSYKGAPVLRQAIAGWYQKWYGVELDANTEVLPLLGSKEGIMHICMTFLNPGDRVLLPNPGYPTYRSAVQLAGGTVVDYELTAGNGFAPDFEQLEVAAAANPVKLMFVNYPHMPTGTLPAGEVFENLVRFARRHQILLIHDNPYSFILNNHPASLLAVPGAKTCVLELNSLSKSHNMAGWRVGMLCGGAGYIQEVLRFKSNMDSGMFLPVQLAAATALGLPLSWYAEVNRVYEQRRNRVFELLQTLDCSFSPNQAGLFVWAAVAGGFKDGFALSDAVLEKAAVFITPGGIFGTAGNGYVRVSLCGPEEKIIEAINRINQS